MLAKVDDIEERGSERTCIVTGEKGSPGEMLRFETIDVEAAQRLLLERARLFADLAPAPRALRSHQTP